MTTARLTTITLASESTLHRLLRRAGQWAHCGCERPAHKRSKPRALVATKRDEIYCWDITYLPTQVRGTFFYWSLLVDLYSRKVVGWQVFDSDSAEPAAWPIQDICLRRGIAPGQITLRSDNGSPLKAFEDLLCARRWVTAWVRWCL